MFVLFTWEVQVYKPCNTLFQKTMSCITITNKRTMLCLIYKSKWIRQQSHYTFQIGYSSTTFGSSWYKYFCFWYEKWMNLVMKDIRLSDERVLDKAYCQSKPRLMMNCMISIEGDTNYQRGADGSWQKDTSLHGQRYLYISFFSL